MPNKPKPTDLYDVASLSISNDPFVGRKRKEGSKYDAIFSQLKIGQRLVCHSDAAARLASQLKQWLVKRGHKNPVVRAVSQYGDGKGGVWWLWNGHGWAGDSPWCGTPLDSDWPGYHTHWTPAPPAPTSAEGVEHG